jgi:hypothetical protein
MILPVLVVSICAQAAADSILVDDFEQFTAPKPGSSPGINTWSVVYERGRTSIQTVLDGKENLPGGPSHVLVISGENNSYDIAKRVPFDRISQFPFLRWEWKVTRFPEGADISNPDRDDSAAQIYVNFDLKSSFLFYPALFSICYYYGSTEKPGQTYLWEGYDTFVEFICVRSVPEDGFDRWFVEERNVLQDYRRAVLDFLDHPDGNVRKRFRQMYAHALDVAVAGVERNMAELALHSFAIWVDSNDTRTGAESRYDNISFGSGPSGP